MEMNQRLSLAIKAETISLAYLIFVPFSIALFCIENDVTRNLILGLWSASLLIGGAGILAHLQFGKSGGVVTPSEFARKMQECDESQQRLERELYILRSKIWEAEGRRSPLLKDTEFAFRLTEEEYEAFAAGNST